MSNPDWSNWFCYDPNTKKKHPDLIGVPPYYASMAKEEQMEYIKEAFIFHGFGKKVANV